MSVLSAVTVTNTETTFQRDNQGRNSIIFEDFILFSRLYLLKKWENMRFFFNYVQKERKSFCSDTDTKIGPWFRYLIPKTGFGRTQTKNACKYHLSMNKQLQIYTRL